MRSSYSASTLQNFNSVDLGIVHTYPEISENANFF